MRERIPLVYFHGIAKGWFVPWYPVFVTADDPARLTFTLQVDDLSASLAVATSDTRVSEADANARRAYVTRTVRQRLHQVAFRDRVIRAYQERCALCSLRHQELLDAAHIADSDPDGQPIVSNGVALCKLHHAAFDRFFFAIRPDFVIEVRPRILAEHDGPMLIVGLQQIHEQRNLIPRRPTDRPDPMRLQRRYAEFLRAG